uniref:BRCT domain-containing protein n=1 Tax=Alexandrium monilatum TaxID=311494 RepID=A0A7S4S4U4_9DINO
MKAGDEEEEDRGNFLDQFRQARRLGEGDEEAPDGKVKEGRRWDLDAADRACNPAPPASGDRPICQECGLKDGEEGGGRYGTDDHEDLFFCGACWKSWDGDDEKSDVEPVRQQQQRSEEGGPSGEEFNGGDASADDIEGAWDPSKRDRGRDGEMALPGSWERPLCSECGREEGERGLGRYGHGEDSDKFFCGRCWMSWGEVDRMRIMLAYPWKTGRDPMDPMLHGGALPPPLMPDEGRPLWGGPAWQEDDDEAIENFFAQYAGGVGSDDIAGAWDPSLKQRPRGPGMALPGSWQRPLCVECGRDEGEEGRGRYGHGPDSDKFYCGRCWMSWEGDDRERIMRAYAPSGRFMSQGHDLLDPMLLCGPPAIHCDPPSEEEEEEDENEGQNEQGALVREAAGVQPGANEIMDISDDDDEEAEAPAPAAPASPAASSAAPSPPARSPVADSPVAASPATPSPAGTAEAEVPSSGPAGLGRPSVFSATGLEVGRLERRTIAKLGGSFTADWDLEVTHLIADTFRRTTKMMCAICAGARIVTPDYLKACREAGALVDDRRFALQDPVCERAFARKHGILGGYALDEALERRRSGGPMLQGVSVYCFPSVVEKHDLPHVVAAAGGRWLQRFPSGSDLGSVLLLAEREASDKTEQQRRRKWKVYDVELLREAACTQVLRKKAWRLS